MKRKKRCIVRGLKTMPAACAVVNIDGHPTHATVNDALRIVEKLEHRAGKYATGETGDGRWYFVTDSACVFFEEMPPYII